MNYYTGTGELFVIRRADLHLDPGSPVAEKVGVLETAEKFLERRAGNANPRDLLTLRRKAGQEPPADADRR